MEEFIIILTPANKSETAWRQAKHKICNNFNL